MALPTLSVVVANYNHARYLPTALRCILEQSIRPLEVLVIDDGSTDNSIAVVEDLARQEPLIKLLPNDRNRGVTYTFNRGLVLARGEYIYGAAADDQVLPGFFAETLAMAAEHQEAGILFGDVVKVDDSGNQLAYFGLSGRKERTYFTPSTFLEDYLANEQPGHSLCGATIYRRDRLVEMGGYSDSLGSWVDTFVTRAIGLRYGACYVPKPFMQWRYQPNSLAHGTTTWEALRIVRRAARQMRSARFRDCFPESYVRTWEFEFRGYLLRQHLAQLPSRCEALLREAGTRATRAAAVLGRMRNRPLLGLPLRRFPVLQQAATAALSSWFVSGVRRRIEREENYLHWRLDPGLHRAGLVKRLCEFVSLPARATPPLATEAMEPDGGHGYRVDLARFAIFAPSDQESVSLLRLFENGKPLLGPHHEHDTIRGLGQGRFSHWGNYLYFSASDNSDPRHNGRYYTIVAPRTLLNCARSFARNRRTRKAG
jgi:glycosyltransferase involved in cell wall biosynthesis